MIGQGALQPALLALGRAEVDHPGVDAAVLQQRHRAGLRRDVVDLGGEHHRRHEQHRRPAGRLAGVVAAQPVDALLADHLEGRGLLVDVQAAEARDLERVLGGRAEAAGRLGEGARQERHGRTSSWTLRIAASRRPRPGIRGSGDGRGAAILATVATRARPGHDPPRAACATSRSSIASIVELATYERAPEQVVGTPQMLARELFGERPSAEALVAELDGRSGRVRPLSRHLLDLGMPGRDLARGSLRPARAPPSRGRRPAARRAGPDHHRARLRAAGVDGAGLEHPRARLLRQARGPAHERLAEPPPDR